MTRRAASIGITAAMAVLALAACQKAETPDQAAARMQAEADSARTAIVAANASYDRYFNGHFADSLAMQFTENGVMMAPGAPAIAGRDSIRAAMTSMPGPPGSTLAMTTVEVAANGPIAVERGNYTFAVPAQGRTPAVNLAGKYLVRWHKVNGQWLIASQIWNEDAPPPAPAR